jgi:hypothetical protein
MFLIFYHFAEMNTETFRELWKLSEKGNSAETCFIRTPQQDHYFEGVPGSLEENETTPDVRSRIRIAV